MYIIAWNFDKELVRQSTTQPPKSAGWWSLSRGASIYSYPQAYRHAPLLIPTLGMRTDSQYHIIFSPHNDNIISYANTKIYE